MSNPSRPNAIAVVALAGRFPGSADVDELWSNLLAGEDAIRDFDPETLERAGIPALVAGHPDFVPSYGVLEGSDWFDEQLFAYPPREARQIDPQQRLFLECAWTALEDAGRDPRRNPETVGVFAGASINKYLLFNLLRNPETYLDDLVYGEELVPTFAGLDYLASRVAFKLGLTGPTISVAAACASSLVAVVLACQSLKDFSCDVAVAGGASIGGRGPRGYMAKRGGMASRTGRCRSFDAAADGSVFGDGVGCVVLKRLEDAQRDNDLIHAVIRGWATNNDSSERVGFSAPSVRGQAAVVEEALLMAELDPRDIGYVEAHGSATQVGDPIEFAALLTAFSALGRTGDGGCGLGSVKSNIGHLDAAAGIAGFIKAVLSVREGIIPGTLHYSVPNPEMPLAGSPFFIDSASRPFPASGGTRLAGVSSFGLGGINAHVIVERAAPAPAVPPVATVVALPIGAATAAALERQLVNYRRTASDPGDRALEDAALAAALRSADMPVRCCAVGGDWPALAVDIERIGAKRSWRQAPASPPPLVYLCGGAGQQYRGMALELHRRFAVFREAFDCCALDARELGVDVGWALAAAEPDAGPLAALRSRTADTSSVAQASDATHAGLFASAYATKALLDSFGLRPTAIAGHSLGELIAAGLAGAMSRAAALRLIIGRARICDESAPGAMLAVPLSAAEAKGYCSGDVAVAVLNTPGHSILSGSAEEVESVFRRLREAGVMPLRLASNSPFHSPGMAMAAGPLAELVRQCRFEEPSIPFHSVALNRRVGRDELSDPAYWIQHLIAPISWQGCVESLVADGGQSFVEIGPGANLSEFGEEIVRAGEGSAASFAPTLAAGYAAAGNPAALLGTLGSLWQAGHAIAWPALYPAARPAFARLPTYPFERNVHWVEAPAFAAVFAGSDLPTASAAPIAEAAASAPPSPTHRVEPPAKQEADGAAPPTGAEAVLCRIWARYLGRPVGVEDDFLGMGGSSLLALQLASAIWREMKIDVHPRRILEERTIARLCAALDFGAARSAPAAAAAGLRARLRELPPDLARAEAETWLAGLVGRDAPADPRAALAAAHLAAAMPDIIDAFRKELGVPVYPNEIQERCSVSRLAELALDIVEVGHERVTARAPAAEPPSPVGRGALVVSSVRSGSTLLRVMLAGHSRLFAPPELHLLEYRTMGERAARERSPDRDQGLERALAEVLGEEAAADRLADYNRRDATSAEVLSDLIQAAEPRLFVDKSPGNSNRIDTLRRAEILLDHPFYIYLVRHPYAVIESVIRNRFVEMMGYGDLDPQVLGELMWHRSNANILEHLATVPSDRQISIRYEDLVRDPEAVMRGITDKLGLDYEDSLIRPYEGRRMRDGLGDPNLHQHDAIRTDFGQAWNHVRLNAPLGSAARSLAVRLGYELNVADSVNAVSGGSEADSSMPSFFKPGAAAGTASPSRRCRLVPIGDVTGVAPSAPALVCCHAMDGTVDLYRMLADALGDDVAAYGLEQAGTQSADLPGLCADYAAALADFEPTRALYLCGWSFGGSVAFELVRHLLQRARGPRHLVLLDTPAPRDRSAEPSGKAAAARQFARVMSAAAGKTVEIGEAEFEGLDGKALTIGLARRLAAEGLLHPALLIGEFSRRFESFAANLAALHSYRARAVDCPTTLVRALDPKGSAAIGEADVELWRTLVGGELHSATLAASHYDMMARPHVETVAAHFRRLLGSD